jgi:hypothetical protein
MMTEELYWTNHKDGVTLLTLNFPEGDDRTLHWKVLRLKLYENTFYWEITLPDYTRTARWRVALRALSAKQMEELLEVLGEAIEKGEYWLCNLVEEAVGARDNAK